MVNRILVRAALLLGASLLAPGDARACLSEAPEPHRLDESEIGLDVLAPEPVETITAVITRGRGPVCEDGACASTSCDDRGVVSLAFSPASDDRTPSESMGYRAVLLEGSLPESLWLSDEAVRGPDRLTLLWTDGATEEQEPLDFTLGLIAVDLAGNESAEAEVWIAHEGRSASAEPTGCSAAAASGLSALFLAALPALLRRRRS